MTHKIALVVLAYITLCFFLIQTAHAGSWKVCFYQDMGQVVDVETYKHIFTKMELGQKALPNGRYLKVSRFVLPDGSPIETLLVNSPSKVKVAHKGKKVYLVAQ